MKNPLLNNSFQPRELVNQINHAAEVLAPVVKKTETELNERLSEKYNAKIYLKREDLQVVRSYKIRGAYNKISQLSPSEKSKGVIAASAGNHAQGVALACKILEIKGKIYMPTTTPQQKIKKVKFFGREFVEVVLIGDTYDDSYNASVKNAEENDLAIIHPFDQDEIIAGQGTVGKEVLEELGFEPDYIILPFGGGGMCSGVGSYFRVKSPQTQIIGVEPQGAPSFLSSIEEGEVVKLGKINSFVDGAAVKQIGHKTFEICKQLVNETYLIPEGKICSTILELYNEDAIVVEPAGGLAISSLDFIRDQIKGKSVVCLVSGGNNDITRMEDIKEQSLIYEGLKHYFVIRFPQRAGALRDFLNNVLGPKDDITYFEYTKKSQRTKGPAVVGIELNDPNDYTALIQRMNKENIDYQHLNNDPLMFSLLI